MPILEMKNVSYRYEKEHTDALKGVSFSFDEGKIYAIVGKSGAGKTTLLSLMSGLCKPTDGTIRLNGTDISKINQYEYRSRNVGVIFQSFNLLPNLTAAENVILSMDISSKKIENKKQSALLLLNKVGLDEDEAGRRILKLSGGQQQRVAIARTLSYDPNIILADEPTGNLDTETQNEIIAIFRGLADEGKCIILVTHSPDVAKQADVVYTLTRPEKSRQYGKQAVSAEA